MTKFITISTDQDELLLINVSHIVLVKKEDEGTTLLLSNLKAIKTEKNYQEIKDLLES